MLSNNPKYLWILIFSSTAFTTLKYEKVLYCYLQTLASLRLLVTRADNLLPCTLLFYGCSVFPRDLHDDRNPVVVKLVLKNCTHIAGYLEVVESYKNRKIASSQSLHYAVTDIYFILYILLTRFKRCKSSRCLVETRLYPAQIRLMQDFILEIDDPCSDKWSIDIAIFLRRKCPLLAICRILNKN